METTQPAAESVSSPATAAESTAKRGPKQPQPAAEQGATSPQKASPGRVVIVKGQISNGQDEHPALITRVWDPIAQDDGSKVDYVNTMLMPDADHPRPVTSVHLFATREAAIAYRERNPGHPAAFWPARV